MADPWELILHHTYRGAPGLVYDSSPLEGAHGVAIGGVDFHPGGQTPDSGSISFQKASSCVHVEATRGWDTLDALRVEAVCRLGLAAKGGHVQPLIGCRDRFLVAVYNSDHVQRTVNVAGVIRTGTPQSFVILSPPLPVHEWMTVRVEFNGSNRLELSVNGVVVRTKTSPVGVGPLRGGSPALVDIGGRGYHRIRFEGRIDDVKISRRNPRAAAQDFLSRPMDSETAECWARWGRRVLDWLRQNPRCAYELGGLVIQMRDALDVVDQDAGLRDRFRRAAESYRKEWSKGSLTSDAMVDTLVAAWAVIDQAELPALASVDLLTGSDCWTRLMMEVPVPQCDPYLIELSTATTQRLEEGRGRGQDDADNRRA